MVLPPLPGVLDAPTTATEEGSKKSFSPLMPSSVSCCPMRSAAVYI
jgi:hypothetical protein